jgi:hypothetical protein
VGQAQLVIHSDIKATRADATDDIGAGGISTGAAISPDKQVGPPARIAGDPVADPTEATRRLYASDWARFSAWCREQGQAPLPTSSQTIAAYLLAVAPGLSRGALGRRRAAIGTMHRQSGLPTPLLDVATQKALRASALPRNMSRPAAPTSGDLRRLAKSCPRDLPGLRDRALLLLVAVLARPEHQMGSDAIGERRGRAVEEPVPRLFLLGLDAEHVRFTATGMVLQLRAHADEIQPSRDVSLTRAMTADACAVRAMEDWLRASDTASGRCSARSTVGATSNTAACIPMLGSASLPDATGRRVPAVPLGKIADGALFHREGGSSSRGGRGISTRSASSQRRRHVNWVAKPSLG